MVQNFTSIFCDDYEVFDTNTDLFVWEIDTRLNREALSYLNDILVDRRYITELMVFHTNRVTWDVYKRQVENCVVKEQIYQEAMVSFYKDIEGMMARRMKMV